MKTLIRSLLVAVIGCSLIGQTFGADDKSMDIKPHIAMKDGKLWVMKDGKTTELKEETTLNDGTKVMTDGTVVQKDGDKKMLKDGDAITWDGKMKKHSKLMKEDEKKEAADKKEASEKK